MVIVIFPTGREETVSPSVTDREEDASLLMSATSGDGTGRSFLPLAKYFGNDPVVFPQGFGTALGPKPRPFAVDPNARTIRRSVVADPREDENEWGDCRHCPFCNRVTTGSQKEKAAEFDTESNW